MAEPPPRTLAEALERAAAATPGPDPAVVPAYLTMPDPERSSFWDDPEPEPTAATPAAALAEPGEPVGPAGDEPGTAAPDARRQRARVVLALTSIVVGVVLMVVGFQQRRGTETIGSVADTTTRVADDRSSTTARAITTTTTGATSTSAATSTTAGALTPTPGDTTPTTRRPTTPTTRRPATTPTTRRPTTTVPPATTAPPTTAATTTTTEATTPTTEEPTTTTAPEETTTTTVE